MGLEKDTLTIILLFSITNCWESDSSITIAAVLAPKNIPLFSLLGSTEDTILNNTIIPPNKIKVKIKGNHDSPAALDIPKAKTDPKIDVKTTILIVLGLLTMLYAANTIIQINLFLIIFFSLHKASILGIEDFRKNILMIITSLIFLFSLTLYVFLYHFRSKLIALMCLECLMLVSISLFYFFSPISSSTLFIMVVLSIFMVLDRVFCVRILISGSRKRSFCNPGLSRV